MQRFFTTDLAKLNWQFHVLVLFAVIVGLAGCRQESPAPVQVREKNSQDLKAKTESNSKTEYTTKTESTPRLAANQQAKASLQKPSAAGLTEEQIDAYLPPETPALTLLWIQPVQRSGHVVAHPDGTSFIHAGARLAKWKIGEDKPEIVYLASSPIMRSIAMSQDGGKLFTGSSEGKISVWDVNTGELLLTKQHSKKSISGLAISPNSESIGVCEGTQSIVVYDTSTLDKKMSLETAGYGAAKLFFVNDDVLVSMGSRGTEVWNLNTQSRLATLDARSLYLTDPNPGSEQFLYLPKSSNTLKTWPTGKDSKFPLDGIESRLRSLMYSRDGTLLSLASHDRINIFDVQSGKRTQAIDMYRGDKAFHPTVGGMSWVPRSNLLILTTASGLIRILGSPDSGKAFDLKPIHSNELSLPARSSKLPTVSELKRLIDLRTLPKLPCVRSNLLVTDDCNGLLYLTPSTIGDVRTFYRHLLGKRGWSEIKPKKLSPFDIEFRKNGFGLLLNTLPSRRRRDDDTSKTKVTLGLAVPDDIDTKSLLPIPKTATAIDESSLPYHLSYHTQAKLFEIEIELLKLLQAAGWTFVDQAQSSHALIRKDKPFRQLTFRQDGCELSVSVSPDRSTGSGNRVAYFLRAGNHGTGSVIPVPTDCDCVESPFLARSNQSVEELTAFYDSQLKQDGWQRIESEQSNDKKLLRYFHELNEFNIELKPMSAGQTVITSKRRRELEFSIGAQSGIEAADVPVSNASSFPTYSGSNIVFDTKSSWKELREDYVTQLKRFGWSLSKERENRMTFKNDNEVLANPDWNSRTISLQGAKIEERFQITISGQGLHWMKLVPRETPFNLSYSIWLRSKDYPLSLDYLDEFGIEMQAIEMQTKSDQGKNPE